MRMILGLIVTLVLCAGCLSPGPAENKPATGILSIYVSHSGRQFPSAEIYVDDAFVGNSSSNKPLLYLKTGERKIRIEADGFKTYERTITVLGAPNQQQLAVSMERIIRKESSTDLK